MSAVQHANKPPLLERPFNTEGDLLTADLTPGDVLIFVHESSEQSPYSEGYGVLIDIYGEQMDVIDIRPERDGDAHHGSLTSRSLADGGLQPYPASWRLHWSKSNHTRSSGIRLPLDMPEPAYARRLRSHLNKIIGLQEKRNDGRPRGLYLSSLALDALLVQAITVRNDPFAPPRRAQR